MAKRKSKKKEKDKSKHVYVYADIETYSPMSDPHFWIGGLKQNGVYKAYDNFKDYWKALTKKIKGKKKVVVFHNSSYDLSILQYHAKRELGYQVNPKKKGKTKAIYMGQHAEIYTDNNLDPIFVVDSKALLPGSLDSYGKQVGMLKGTTPILVDYRSPTDDDWAYLKQDIDILEYVSKAYKLEESIEKGLMTVSSLSQSSVNSIYCKKTNKKYKSTGLKRKHSGKVDEGNKLPLPSAVSSQIESDTEAFKVREVVYSIKTKKGVYGVNEDTVERYRKYITRYWSGLLDSIVDNFAKRQKEAKKYLDGKKYDKELMGDFFDIPLPKLGQSPHGKWIADDFHKKKIIEGANRIIAPSMRGGMTYANMRHVNKILVNGGILDVNSLYPFILMKFGIPSVYVGNTEGLDPSYGKYFIAEIKRLRATVKPGKHPFLKRNTNFTNDKVYEENIDWELKYKNGIPDTVLCSVDINWMYEIYDIQEIEYGKVFYFEEDKLFTESVREHIKYWREKKENATDVVSRTYAKFMLNTIWGRWGMFEKEVEEGAFKIDIGDKDTNYVSAIFTTAYARVYLNKMMNWFGEDLVYTDTDSVHFLFGNKVKDEKDLRTKLSKHIDPKEFGKWDFEKSWTKAKYIKAKTYAMEDKGKVKTVTAGRRLPELDSLDDFAIGNHYTVTQNKTDEYGRDLIYQSTYTLKLT